MKTETKGTLAKKYGVHPNTFRNWLSKIPGLILQPHQRILTPKQVKLILEHLGEPG